MITHLRHRVLVAVTAYVPSSAYSFAQPCESSPTVFTAARAAGFTSLRRLGDAAVVARADAVSVATDAAGGDLFSLRGAEVQAVPFRAVVGQPTWDSPSSDDALALLAQQVQLPASYPGLQKRQPVDLWMVEFSHVAESVPGGAVGQLMPVFDAVYVVVDAGPRKAPVAFAECDSV